MFYGCSCGQPKDQVRFCSTGSNVLVDEFVWTTRLCDGIKDCKNGADEQNCSTGDQKEKRSVRQCCPVFELASIEFRKISEETYQGNNGQVMKRTQSDNNKFYIHNSRNFVVGWSNNNEPLCPTDSEWTVFTDISVSQFVKNFDPLKLINFKPNCIQGPSPTLKKVISTTRPTTTSTSTQATKSSCCSKIAFGSMVFVRSLSPTPELHGKHYYLNQNGPEVMFYKSYGSTFTIKSETGKTIAWSVKSVVDCPTDGLWIYRNLDAKPPKLERITPTCL